MRKILVFLLIIGGLLFVKRMTAQRGVLANDLQVSSTKTDTDKSKYDFSLKELGGNKVYSLNDFKGKPLFIDFWASWCPPCRAASPYVERLAEEFEGRVSVVGINLDSDPNAALNYLGGKNTAVLHLEGGGSDVSQRYGARGIPTFVIMDAEGKILISRSGFAPPLYEDWTSILESQLK